MPKESIGNVRPSYVAASLELLRTGKIIQMLCGNTKGRFYFYCSNGLKRGVTAALCYFASQACMSQCDHSKEKYLGEDSLFEEFFLLSKGATHEAQPVRAMSSYGSCQVRRMRRCSRANGPDPDGRPVPSFKNMSCAVPCLNTAALGSCWFPFHIHFLKGS